MRPKWITTDDGGVTSFVTTGCAKCGFTWITQEVTNCPRCEAARLKEVNLGDGIPSVKLWAFNLNDYVHFKLTAEGAAVLERYYKRKFKTGEHTKLQAWQFINCFGAHFFMSAPQMVERTEVLIEGKNLISTGVNP